MATTNVYVDALRITVTYTDGGGTHVVGPLYPTGAGSVAAGDDTGYTSTHWISPLNICADDGSPYASPLSGYAVAGPFDSTSGTVSDRLVGIGFGFDIPTGATITNIKVEGKITTDCDNGFTAPTLVALLKGGLVSTAFSGNALTSSPAYNSSEGYFTGGQCVGSGVWQTLGHGLWGASWSSADINSPLFGLAFRLGVNWQAGEDDGSAGLSPTTASVLSSVTQSAQIISYTPSSPAGDTLNNYYYGGVNFSDPSTTGSNPNSYVYNPGGQMILPPTGYGSGYSGYASGLGLFPFTPTGGIVLPTGFSTGTYYGILNLLNGIYFGYGRGTV